MSASVIAAIVVIITIECYYIISEIRLADRTTRGTDNTLDKGTRRLVWRLTSIGYNLAWIPVIFNFGRLVVLGGWLTWVGVAIMISGVVFRQYAIAFLGKFFTATIQIKKDHQLIQTGPYRYIRHPSYLGILILSLGLGIAMANWISLILCLVLPTIGLIRRIRFEEKELEQHFGKRYQDYMKNTRRVIPFIY
jgi:protein-S-isoprenylcysteine O-methyltransferase Ste14